ncbi:MAG: galactose-1-phosphate uridylyltransferase [Candidatus Spechtbacteria bacterium RIFCSPLOWO2_01_FULL_43_12]|uniref:Galactose-1-phosphate uridylyltransferase n=1 Tax=Candidatus Spechtbacteria bacterium RIFCSPLOWO2_01_FULL_43_12 TaxID=1802162 RepID=A0A1G2HDQ1_9BACT|nr:MAG: galactose-1-phosphate uridylyltransferase [Candidatus Spechtbacteria bacterium RIFCSPLOWO2_01_FULL_43_12]
MPKKSGSKKYNISNDHKRVSELRQDLVTGDWIAIATSRARRPQEYAKKGGKELEEDPAKCPFEDPQAHGNAPPLLVYKNKKHPDWSLQVIPNKYPAFTHMEGCGEIYEKGPYLVRDGRGYHEVIITRDHKKHLALLTIANVAEVLTAYKERYNALKGDKCVKYISIFHNHGADAGASLFHPHSQLIAVPFIPSDIHRSLVGSNMYFRKNGECVHCAMIRWEIEDKKRLVFENEMFVAFCPFVSRSAFEIRIFPKDHRAYFENLPDDYISQLADALRATLAKLNKLLNDPAYNFFVHTAPVDGPKYPNYHWHIEVLPKTAVWAGFELGTGMEISTIEPQKAAKFLRDVKI